MVHWSVQGRGGGGGERDREKGRIFEILSDCDI